MKIEVQVATEAGVDCSAALQTQKTPLNFNKDIGYARYALRNFE